MGLIGGTEGCSDIKPAEQRIVGMTMLTASYLHP